MRVWILIIICHVACLETIAQIKGEIELSGFLLGQYRKAVYNELGPPLQRVDTDDGWIYEFHKIRPDTSVYALFKYSAADTLRIYAIQLNGREYNEMHPFKGLRLGANEQEVNAQLGGFNQTDTIDNPKVIVRYFEGTNYSVEIDEAGKLYGIQIFGSILRNKTTENFPDFDGFSKAILSKDHEKILYWLAPDVEVYAGEKVIAYQGAARAEYLNQNSELCDHLFGSKKSLRYVFEVEKSEATPELRLLEDKSMLLVYKFQKSKILEEIVFTEYAGSWKVYEVKFRN